MESSLVSIDASCTTTSMPFKTHATERNNPGTALDINEITDKFSLARVALSIDTLSGPTSHVCRLITGPRIGLADDAVMMVVIGLDDRARRLFAIARVGAGVWAS